MQKTIHISKIFLTVCMLMMSIQVNSNPNKISDPQMIDEILNFWFDYDSNEKTLFNRAMWWQKSDETDNKIRSDFEAVREKAVQGEYDDWLNTAKGSLAYIILIDQFSRNLYRNSPKMYEHDPLALSAAKSTIEKGLVKELSFTEQVFVYMPFEHSENLADQKICADFFEGLIDVVDEDGKSTARDFYGYAKDHHDIVAKFGRFPHRNEILSRESTQEEIEFMKTHKGY